MITSLQIENFRGFRALAIDDFDRLNLIVGQNNVGKTALLEAMLVPHHMDPRKMLRRRGPIRADRAADYEEHWSWLFHERNTDSTILISEKTVACPVTARVSIVQSTDPIQVDLPLIEVDDLHEETNSNERIATLFKQLRMELRIPAKEMQVATAQVVTGQFKPRLRVRYSKPIGLPFPMSFSGASRFLTQRDAERYSELERRGEQTVLIDAAREIDGRIRRFSVQVVEDRPVLYADVGMKQLMPLYLLGDGFNSFLSMLLGIADARGGVVLIDEIENGLHWSVLPSVWRAVAAAARAADVQIFATTHSWECIRVAHETLAADDHYDLRLHRLEVVDGMLRVVTYNRETTEAALVMGLEMR